MTRPKIVYMDQCAWQELSKDSERIEALLSLQEAGRARFALSPLNQEELPFAEGSVRKRVRVARAMLKVSSPDHMFRGPKWMWRAEIAAAVARGARIAPFCPRDSADYRRLRDCLADCAREKPLDVDLFDGLDDEVAHGKERWHAIRKDAVEKCAVKRLKEKAESMGVAVHELPDEEIFADVLGQYLGYCERELQHEAPGRVLLGSAGIRAALPRLHSVRLLTKALLLLADRQAQSRWKMGKGDSYDVQHLVYGWYADLFVTHETQMLNKLCSEVHDFLDELGLHWMLLNDFLASESIS